MTRVMPRVAAALMLAGACLLAAGRAASAQSPVEVSLNFDNDTYSEYTLGYSDALQPANVAATFYVNSGTIGTSNHLTWPEVTSLASAG
ncbi:MAG TPA: hypothetical protein VMA95_16035, partial [Streptosporangiaceae bacterium]|nr:hypothetical protein [Streptosporangiaceae bacterium]